MSLEYYICIFVLIQENAITVICSAVKYCFTTKLGKLIDKYQKEVNQHGKNGKTKNSTPLMTTSVENIYLQSPDMQMLLNLLAEKEGMWSAILILSIFDAHFKNEFKVMASSKVFLV